MKVLLVDDSKASRMITLRALRQVGLDGLEVQEANNGQEALSLITEAKPDLVLCDWNMPEMSGIELLEKLKEDGVDVRFGFLTSEGTEDVKQRAQNANALFFVSKPVTTDKLQAAMDGLKEGE